MSIAALEIKRRHRAYQVDNGPDSQEFSSTGPVLTFQGIFEKAYDYKNQDGGHQFQNRVMPAILVSVVPTGFEKGTIITVPGVGDFQLASIGNDYEGVPILWLA